MIQLTKITVGTKVVMLSPAWLKLIEIVKSRPMVTFNNLKFKDGEPLTAEMDLKLEEFIKF